jgi:regulatory protein
MNKTDETEMYSRMAAYCSTGEHCKQDVEKKLSNAGLTAEVCERILSRLSADNFIDESRYARSFVNDKLRFNKWGRARIKYELRRKNIPQEIVYASLRDIDEEAYRTILMDILSSKKKSIRGKDEHDTYSKLQRFALGRGFEGEEIYRCLLQLFDGRSYEEDAD